MIMFQIKTVLLACLVAFFTILPPALADFRVESIDNDYQGEIEAAADEGKRLIMFFHQTGCPYCDKMKARVHPDAGVQAYFEDKFVMMETNIKGNLDIVMPDGTPGTEYDFARKSRVRATPVYIFYDTDGSQALRATGFLDPKRFKLAGQYVVEGVHKTKKSFFRYLQENN